MANEATSIKYVQRPITVDDGPHKHVLKPGMFVSAPHSMIQRDPEAYPEPDKFVPDRFIETDPETGKQVVRYGKLRPWGAGSGMCKGRTFAEREIIAVAASVMSLWDIVPPDGTWKIPAMIDGIGVKKPVQDVRVRITKRTKS